MLNFASDYVVGAHQAILQKLQEVNGEKFPGYGTDVYTKSAAEKIKKACGREDAQVFFLVGGTQTNSTVIATMLAPFEGAVAVETGHIEVHEAGAVEYTGHKVLTLPAHNGKMDPKELDEYISRFYQDGSYEHMVFPGMAYISHPTEYGTLYTKAELEEIYSVCQKHKIPLFIDGARLGYGLMSLDTDVSLEFLASHCDVFYIGGTKVGALFGEAVVFTHNNAPRGFYTMTKQHGAMLAKGWLTGLQFDVLFTDDLYMKISKNAIEQAEKIKALMKKHNLPFLMNSPTNQQFVIMENAMLEKLSQNVIVEPWEKVDETHTAVRFCTAWSTTDEDIAMLERVMEEL